MSSRRGLIAALPLLIGLTLVGSGLAIPFALGRPQAAQGPVVRSIGTVQAIQGNTLTLKTDSGPEVQVLIQSSTRMLRVEPGQRSLSGATPLQLQDLQVGDRVLIIGTMLEGGKAVAASSLIAIKQSDIARHQETEQMEWQKNGVGGLVKAVDAATGVVTIRSRMGGVNKTINIHITPSTILRRYAPGSVRFQDAKLGTLSEIKPGDQLRARGTFSAGGTDLNAAEIVSGSFRNIAGTVLAVDSTANQVTVMDRLTKQPVVVTFTPESQLRKLPENTAQMIALRLRRAVPAQPTAPGGQQAAARSAADRPSQPSPAGSPVKAERFNQLVRNLPPIRIGDLHKGDVVMIVSTEGATSSTATAIKLVSGAGPILTAGKQAATLQSLWSGFSTSGGGGEVEEGGGSAAAQAPASR